MPRLCVIPGDGIGLEVIPAAVTVLQAAVPDLELVFAQAGWACFQECGSSVPTETLQMIRHCGAALFGAVSSPSRKVEGYRSAILTLRQELDLFANIRPVRSLPRVSPRPDVDLIVVRENSEGLYVGRERIEADKAIAEQIVTRNASIRIGRVALDLLKNNGRLTIVHKANILPISDGLFRDSLLEVASAAERQGKTLTLEELLVDNAALRLVSQPDHFDVLVTTNLYGDILSDIAAYWCGGLGFAASLNLGEKIAIAEPVHGSAPDIAGRGIANPIAAILSGALILRYVWKMEATAEKIEHAVEQAMEKDFEISNNRLTMMNSTSEITQAVLDRLN